MTDPTPTRDEAVLNAADQMRRAIESADPAPVAQIVEWRLLLLDMKEALMWATYSNSALRGRVEAAEAALSAPAPASGRVDAGAAIAKIIDPECFKLLAEGNNLTTGQAANYRDAYGKAHLILASFSPAATPVSEDEPGATVRTIQPLMCEAVIDFIPKQNGHLPFDVGSKLYALAKPASSPAGGDVVQTLIDKTEKLIEAADDMGWSCNSSSADQAIREARDAVRAALSQSTSAGGGE